MNKAVRVTIGIMTGLVLGVLLTPLMIAMWVFLLPVMATAGPISGLAFGLKEFAGIDLTGPKGVLRGKSEGKNDA